VPRYQPVSVNRLLSSTADAHRDSATQKNLVFEVRLREPDVLLWTDPDAAKGMLTNLLSNAVKYTRRGRVFVGSVRMRDGLRIDVRDSGVGIPGSKKDLIYKEFVRLGNPGTTDAAGQGIGLSIVANYCGKLAGHDVKHRSREGMGSCFSLRFPLAPVSSFAADDAGEAPVAVLPERLYLVIVEDNEQFRATLQTDLYSAGYDTHANVKAFASVAELRRHFEVAQHRAPNIVISDYSLLDGENARDVLAVVDEFFGWETVPAIVYTAEVMSQLPFAREHTYLLAKSSDPAPLLNLIQRAIAAARRDDQED
jgi:CheY-like chemotaxis protein